MVADFRSQLLGNSKMVVVIVYQFPTETPSSVMLDKVSEFLAASRNTEKGSQPSSHRIAHLDVICNSSEQIFHPQIKHNIIREGKYTKTINYQLDMLQ